MPCCLPNRSIRRGGVIALAFVFGIPVMTSTSQPAGAPQIEPTKAPPGLSPSSIDTITAQFRRHGVESAPARPDNAIRIASYNIHELFDDQDDPGLQGREEDIGRVMIESRQAATANALRRIDADIVALQEVESLDALIWYRDARLSDMGYEHAASVDVGHPLGLEQAVLSRFPIIDTQTWTDRVIGEHPALYRGRPNRYAGEPMTFRRSPLMAEIALADSPDPGSWDALPESDRLTVVVVHFKTGDASDAWRLAEGRALAVILDELKADRPDRRLVVLGDFAVPAEEGHARPILDAGFVDPFASALDRTTPDAIATGIDGKRSCYVLLGNGVAAVPASPPFVLGTVAPPTRLDRRMGFRMPGFASDHYPVVVDLQRPEGTD